MKITCDLRYDEGGWTDADATTEYQYRREATSPEEIVVVYARSKNYSYNHNNLLSGKMATHYRKNLVHLMDLSETDFYMVYQIKINNQVLFQNDEAVSDIVLDQWLNDQKASFRYQRLLLLEFNADYSVKSHSYKEYYTSK